MFLSRGQQVLIVLSLLALLTCAGYGLFSYVEARRTGQGGVTFHDSPFPKVEKPETVVVHVAGQVKKPGVYELKPGSRVRDAIAAAQGATPVADIHALNLAAFLRDGEKIWVPSRQEEAVTMTTDADPLLASAPPRSHSQPPHAASVHSATRKPSAQWLKQHKISLNRATAQQLQQLPSIGPVLAQRILDYRREHGRFNSVEDLMNVSGIGTRKFEQLRDFVVP